MHVHDKNIARLGETVDKLVEQVKELDDDQLGKLVDAIKPLTDAMSTKVGPGRGNWVQKTPASSLKKH